MSDPPNTPAARDGRSAFVRYAVAIAGVVIGGGLRIAFTPPLGTAAPMSTFMPAIVVAAWFGGLWPGLTSTALSLVIALSPLFANVHVYDLTNRIDVISLAIFTGIGLIVSAFTESLHRRLAREQATREAAEKAQQEATRLASHVKSAQERVSQLVDGVPGVIWEAWGQPNAANQRIDYVSPYVETMLGYSVDDWLNQPNFWLTIVHPDDRWQAAAVAAAAYHKGEAHTNTFRWISKDGRAVWVESHATVLRDDSGRPTGMRGVTFDITSRKQTEDALRQSFNDVTRMQQVSTRLLRGGDFRVLLQEILGAAIDVAGADRGTIHLFDGDVLRLEAHRNFSAAFQEFSREIQPSQAASGTALVQRERVIVEDIVSSPIFMGTPALDVLLAADVRAVQSTPLLSRSGRILGILSTHYRQPTRPSERVLHLLDILSREVSDLIEQQQAEAALRAKDAELELVINQTPFMLIRCGRDLRYRFVSPAYAEMLNRLPADLIGTPIADTLGQAGLDALRPHIDAVLEGKPVEFEHDIEFAATGIRTLHVVHTPDTDDRGQVIGWIASILDVTERKRSDRVTARLAAIVDSSEDAIISKDLNGIITSWNAAAERMFGYTAAEAIGESITLTLPPDRQHEEQAILRRVRDGHSVERLETERRRKDGSRLHISLTVSPIRDSAGQIIGASKIARDISYRVRADAERMHLLASEQTARAHAEAANRAKDEFLATVSHELRTPLNAILGWAAMLQQTAPADNRTARGLQSIDRNTRALSQLVDDLLDVSRMITGNMRIDVTPVDLDDVIDAAVEAVLPAATAKDIDIRVERATAGLTMMGDATRVQQAVWNLLSNAVKFTPSGGRVDVHTSIEDGEIELSITDSGIGIEPAFLPYVFDRFRQADASTTRAYGGLGLGLAIVRHLVELHGGRVRAESDGTNTGTRFIINLPRKELLLSTTERRPVPTETARDVGIRLDNLRVLLVDDDHTSCDVMSEALRGYGASVHAAMSVAEAVDCLAAFQPDLVLSDVAMPVQDGFALLRELRSREILLGRRVPIAAVTARARPEDREQALAAGFDEYLTKPVEPAALAGAVSALATMANQ